MPPCSISLLHNIAIQAHERKNCAMEKLTIALDDDVAGWVRALATRNGTSAARLVEDLLRERMLAELEYDAAMKRFLARKPMPLGLEDESHPTRDELHDRENFRRR